MQYLLEIKDDSEKDFLLALLAKFDFVQVTPREKTIEAVENMETEEEQQPSKLMQAVGTLDRDINAKELRKKAWGLQE